MTNRPFFKNRKIGRSSADIEKSNTDLFLFVFQNGITRCKRFEYHIIHMQPGPLNTFINILGCRNKTCDDMHNCFHSDAGHSDWIVNTVLTIYDILLRNHVNNFSIQRQGNALRIFNQSIDIFLRDFIFRPADTDDAAALKTLNVVASDADCHRTDFDPRLLFGILHGNLNRSDGLFNVRHDPARQPVRWASPYTQYFHFPGIIFIG